jgi:hypothetical protein
MKSSLKRKYLSHNLSLAFWTWCQGWGEESVSKEAGVQLLNPIDNQMTVKSWNQIKTVFDIQKDTLGFYQAKNESECGQSIRSRE